MKKYILALIISFAASYSYAQVDTTQLPITLQFKVKHIGYMAANLASSNSLKDKALRDSLVKYIGSGLLQDSIVNATFKAGYVLSFMNSLFYQNSAVTYSAIYEIGNGATGYTGLVAQLLVKSGNTLDPQKGTASWLFGQIWSILTSGQNIMTSTFNTGNNWLKTPIIQN